MEALVMKVETDKSLLLQLYVPLYYTSSSFILSPVSFASLS